MADACPALSAKAFSDQLIARIGGKTALARLTELLKQPQYSPLPVEEQVVAIFAGVRGYLDKVKVADVTRFEQFFLDAIRADGTDILASIRDEKALTEDTEAKLAKFLDDFARTFS